MIRIDVRWALEALALLAVAALPLFAGFAGLGWEFAQLCGLVGAIACLALCAAPVRPRDTQPPTLLSVGRHALIGWVALAAGALHIGGLLIADRTVVEYVKPTMPLYQWAGAGASALLLGVILTAIPRWRRRLFARYRSFQATHVLASALLVALLVAHVVATNRYAFGGVRRALIVAAALGALTLLLRRGRRSGPTPDAPPERPRGVFGRHSTLVFGGVLGIAAALLAVFAAGARGALREPLVKRSAALPLAFPHDRHAAVNCLQCHHNYADGKGLEGCIECHRSARADLRQGAEARFHAFCFECHRHPEGRFVKHGPIAGCSGCHRAADLEASPP